MIYHEISALLAAPQRRAFWHVAALLAALIAPTIADAQGRPEGLGIQRFELVVTHAGNGAGTVTSDIGAIDCGATCADLYDADTMVTLTASADSGSSFAGWGGACSGVGTTCAVSMSEARIVSANFRLKIHSVSVGKSGDGVGSIVVNAPEGVCKSKAPCVFTTTHGSEVRVQAAANPSTGSRFGGWSGDCSGNEPTCSLTITQTTAITGVFGLAQWSLVVSTSGEGVVKSIPAGINCGSGGASDCAFVYTHGTSVLLIATPVSGYVFSGWTAFCSGTGVCIVPMTQSRAVQAIFEEEGLPIPVPVYRTFLPAVQ